MGHLNAWLAVKITNSVGTMWAAYIFALLGGTGVWAAMTSNASVVLIVGAVSGYFLQLVLLPIIMVGQNVQQAASDARAQADHETLSALNALTAEIHTINEQQTEILKKIQARG